MSDSTLHWGKIVIRTDPDSDLFTCDVSGVTLEKIHGAVKKLTEMLEDQSFVKEPGIHIVTDDSD